MSNSKQSEFKKDGLPGIPKQISSDPRPEYQLQNHNIKTRRQSQGFFWKSSNFTKKWQKLEIKHDLAEIHYGALRFALFAFRISQSETFPFTL